MRITPLGHHPQQRVIPHHIVVIQPGHGVQADQPVADSPAQFMPTLNPLGQRFVFGDQQRQVKPVEHHLMALGARDQPAEDRHGDHEQVQRPMHQFGQRGLPARRRGEDLRRRAQAAGEQPQPHQHKHRQAEHEVRFGDQRPATTAFGKDPAKFDAGVNQCQQHQHQPVQRDRHRAVT